jgi:hypothetical protein
LTLVPQAMASIIVSPNDSGQSIGNGKARFIWPQLDPHRWKSA